MTTYSHPGFWELYGKRNPFGPRIRRCFWALVLWGLATLAIVSYGVISLPLKQVHAPAEPTSPQQSGRIGEEAVLRLDKPDLVQRFFLTDGTKETNMFTAILIIIGSLLIIFIAPGKKESGIFSRDVSMLVWLLGGLIILHGITIPIIHGYEYRLVSRLTHEQYIPARNIPWLFSFLEIYLGFLVIAVGVWYRQGVRLQQEQSLTI